MTTAVERVFRADGPRLLALLTRELRSLDAAEEALQDAHVAALDRWAVDGTPESPAAWLLTVARRRARDRLRRDATLARKLPLLIVDDAEDESIDPADHIDDDRLRLIFTACHPALAPASRVALTLRYAAGLTTAEVARLFHTSEPTMAARLTRAKQKIAQAGIPYRVPRPADLPARLMTALDVVYLVFTEGHAPARGDRVVRTELCEEAIRLARTLDVLLPEREEVAAVLALMLLTHARAPARTGAGGELIPLDEQDRSAYDRALIDEGRRVLARAGDGRHALEARIAAEHAEARTDWHAVAALYAELEAVHPTPAVRLNRVVAVLESAGPREALALLDSVDAQLDRGHAPHLVRAEVLGRLGDTRGAGDALARAEELAGNAAVRAHLAGRRAALGP